MKERLESAEIWNRWRAEHDGERPTFMEEDFTGRDFRGYDFRNVSFIRVLLTNADLRGADCTGATFSESRLINCNLRETQMTACGFFDAICNHADFSGVDLSRANFQRASCVDAKFVNANLRGADFTSVILHMADLSGADCTDADFSVAQLIMATARGTNFTNASLEMGVVVNADLTGATLVGTRVFGLSAWNVELTDAHQQNIIITRPSEPAITCDDIEIAQFIYLLIENRKIRKVIDGVTSKMVLILGRFIEERKAVLDAIRDALRHLDFTPVIFDFEKPASKDITGTIETLARMSRFIIADLTHPSSIPHELATIVPHLRTTPIVPIQLEGTAPYAMFEDWAESYRWVLERKTYVDTPSLIASLPAIIEPAQNWRRSRAT